MKVLLDEDLDVRLVEHLAARHQVSHVARIGWKGKSNGDLLRDAVSERFDVLVTGDSHLPYQQDLASLDIAVIRLRAARMTLAELVPLVPSLLEAIEVAPRRAATVVPSSP